MEGQFRATHGTLVDLSEQQLLDCDTKKYGNHGCSSELDQPTYDYIEKYGIEKSSDYPYTGIVSNALKGFVFCFFCFVLFCFFNTRCVALHRNADRIKPVHHCVPLRCRTSLTAQWLWCGCIVVPQ